MSYTALLNTTCTIQKRTATQDATYMNETVTWADYDTNVKCRLDMASGGERRKTNDILVKATHLLFIEHRTDIDELDYRVVCGGVTYNILLVAHAGGTTHHVEMYLEKVV